MAVMRTAPDGSISARNITKEANGDGWRDLSTGNRLSGADAVHGLTGVQGINPYDLQQTGDALEQHAAGKPGKERAYGAFQREDTQFAAKFQKNDAGGWNTLVGGTSYETPQQAAAALGADSMAVYDGRSDMKGFDMAKIAASDVNLADQAAFEAGLSEHAVSGPAGECKGLWSTPWSRRSHSSGRIFQNRKRMGSNGWRSGIRFDTRRRNCSRS